MPRPKHNIDDMLVDELNIKLLQLLKINGGMERTELVRRTGAAWSTVYDHLTKLWLYDIVSKRYKSRRSPGRPKVIWSLSHEFKKKMP